MDWERVKLIAALALFEAVPFAAGVVLGLFVAFWS